MADARRTKVQNVDKQKQPINETGHHVHGEVFETTPDRVKALGDRVKEVPADTPIGVPGAKK